MCPEFMNILMVVCSGIRNLKVMVVITLSSLLFS